MRPVLLASPTMTHAAEQYRSRTFQLVALIISFFTLITMAFLVLLLRNAYQPLSDANCAMKQAANECGFNELLQGTAIWIIVFPSIIFLLLLLATMWGLYLFLPAVRRLHMEIPPPAGWYSILRGPGKGSKPVWFNGASLQPEASLDPKPFTGWYKDPLNPQGKRLWSEHGYSGSTPAG